MTVKKVIALFEMGFCVKYLNVKSVIIFLSMNTLGLRTCSEISYILITELGFLLLR